MKEDMMKSIRYDKGCNNGDGIGYKLDQKIYLKILN